MKKTHFYVLLVCGVLLLCAPRVQAGYFEALDCIGTFDGDLSSCAEARSICHTHCSTQACHQSCDSAYQYCRANASSGGPLGIPQGFTNCLYDAFYEEPMVQTDLDNLWTQCMNGCLSERSYCFALGDQMNPTPEGWDDGCYTMGIECTVSCMEIGPLNF